MRGNLGSITWVLGVLSTWVLPCLSTKQNPKCDFVLKAVLMHRCLNGPIHGPKLRSKTRWSSQPKSLVCNFRTGLKKSGLYFKKYLFSLTGPITDQISGTKDRTKISDKTPDQKARTEYPDHGPIMDRTFAHS